MIKICDRIKYLITEKIGITDSANHNFARIRIDSYNSLPIEKYWLFIMLHYSLSQLLARMKINTIITYFLKKGTYKDKSNTEYFQMNAFIS